MTDSTDTIKPRRYSPLLFLAVPMGVLVWTYWPSLTDLASTWSSNSSYSHGWLVPIFAAFLLWYRRGLLDMDRLRPSLFGLLLLTVGIGLRLRYTYVFRPWLEQLSLIPCTSGVFLMVGGWNGLRWGWPASVFLFFMVPLPFSLSDRMSEPLQHLATICATFLMQLLGLPALAEGNTILLNEASIGVVEACSGLRMLMVFFALSSAVALISKRPWLEKLILVTSAIPIALAVNILRITATGILHELVNSETANAFFHDVAGWFMMPLALGLLWGECRLLSRLFLPADAPDSPGREPRSRKIVTPRSARVRPTLPPAPRERKRTPSSGSVRNS